MTGEDQNTDTLAAAATGTVATMTPQFTGPMTQFGNTASNVPPPVTFQPPQQQNFAKPQGSFATVGERKRADRQSILQNTAQLVKSGANFIQQNKMRSLSMDIERLMEASHGRDEALQALQQNPNDPQAKAALERNTGIINTIAADPKKNKLIGKAFNVDLFGGGKNQKENAAMIDAWKNFNTKQQQGDKTALNPIAQRFSQMQPQRLQMSAEAQQQAEMIKAGLAPNANEMLKANVTAYRAMSTAQTEQDKNRAYAGRTQTMLDISQKHYDAVELQTKNAFAIAQGRNKVMEDHIKAYERVENNKNATAQDRVKAMQERTNLIKAKNGLDGIAKQMTGLNTYRKSLQDQIAKDQAELDKRGGWWKSMSMSDKDAGAARLRIDTNTGLLQNVDGRIQQLQGALDQFKSMGIDTAAPPEPGSSQENPEDWTPPSEN